MITLSTLKDTSRKPQKRKRVGRGIGSVGVTCGRGQKGAGARSGYKRRASYEGGQVRMFEKMPTRGFTRGRFLKRLDTINLGQISAMYAEGEVVSLESLRQKGWLSGPSHGLKILGDGDLAHTVTIHADAISRTALQKCEKVGAPVVLPE